MFITRNCRLQIIIQEQIEQEPMRGCKSRSESRSYEQPHPEGVESLEKLQQIFGNSKEAILFQHEQRLLQHEQRLLQHEQRLLQHEQRKLQIFKEICGQRQSQMKKYQLMAFQSMHMGRNKNYGVTKNKTKQILPQNKYSRKISEEAKRLAIRLLRQNVPIKEIIKETGISRSSIRNIRLVMAAEMRE